MNRRLNKRSPQRIALGMMMVLWLLAAFSAVAQQAPIEEEGVQPFGANLFTGNFLKTREDGLNPNYVVTKGDQVAVRVWGALAINDVFTVDSQGNIFLPEIGPVHLEGKRNADLTRVVEERIGKVYSKSFRVYTSLVTSQPVLVYVTGLVANPGRYAGIPSDSLLYFLDLAGGIDPAFGSYRDIEIIRNGKRIAHVDLYRFILDGEIPSPQFRDGDTILVKRRGAAVEVLGEVARPASVEFQVLEPTGAELFEIIPKAARVTEVTLEGIRDGQPIHHSLTIDEFSRFPLDDGDRVILRSEGRAPDILVRLEGEFEGASVFSVPRGTRLLDFLDTIPVNPELADTASIHLRRKSVAQAQRDAISDSLFRLERSALLALSDSAGEADIRVKEAELTKKFVERARLIDPLGRVVTSQGGAQQNLLLESDDVIVIPSKTRVVRIGGEVLISQAVLYDPSYSVQDYIEKAGGYSDRADDGRVIVLRPNAEVALTDLNAEIGPGDEILVPPRIDTKVIQNASDIMQIIYQIAVAASVALNL